MSTNEIFARINYDVERLRCSGIRDSDITIHLSLSLYNRLHASAEGIVNFSIGDTLFGCPVRLALPVSAKGTEEEWFVSAAHGVVPKEGALI